MDRPASETRRGRNPRIVTDGDRARIAHKRESLLASYAQQNSRGAAAGVLPIVRGALSRVPAWLWLVVLSGSLRLVNLGAESVWYDESFTALLARLQPKDLWTAILGDVHPPLWYLVEWVNVRIFGTSELALRLPSALLGVLGVWLLWRLALALKFDRRTAFIAGIIAAIMPGFLLYSQDARMYPLLTVCVLMAANAALRGGWVVFGIACLGAVYAQNLGLLYVGAMGLVILLSSLKSRTWGKPLLALLGVGGLWLPWGLGGMLHQMSLMGNGFWLPALTPGSIVYPLIFMTMGTRVADAFQLHIYIAALAATGIGIYVSRPWLKSRGGLLYLAVAFGAPAIAVAVSLLWRNIYLARAFLPSAVSLSLIWAYGLTHLSRPNRRVALAVVGPALVIGIIGHYFPSQGRKDVRSWLNQTIVAQYQPGDVVYHVALDSAILANYYLDGYPYRLMPEASDLSQSLTAETKKAIGFKEAHFEDLASEGFKRVWLIDNRTPLLSQEEIDEYAWIKANYRYDTIAHFTDQTDIAETWIRLVYLDGQPS